MEITMQNLTRPDVNTLSNLGQGGNLDLVFDLMQRNAGEGGTALPDPVGPMARMQGLFADAGGLDGLKTVMGGLQGLGSIYASLKGLGLAKDQMNFQKRAFDTNMTNQTKTYNTALQDRIRTRTHAEGGSPQQAEKYLAANRL